MEILNVGIPELVFILLIMLVVLGPARMETTARSLAATLRRVTQSDFWRQFRATRRQIEDLPSNLLRESGVNEFKQQVDQINKSVRDDVSIEPPRHQPRAYPARPIGAQPEPTHSPLDPDYDAPVEPTDQPSDQG